MSEDEWAYWVGKYGLEDAVNDYLPPVLKADPVVVAALAQMTIGRLALQARISELLKEGRSNG